MKRMKSWVLQTLAALTIVLVSQVSFAETGDPAIDTLLKKLTEKGVISSQDAKELERELKEPIKNRNKELAKDLPKPKLPFDITIRFQPRFEFGDLLVDKDGKYTSESDIFVRRARLYVKKNFEKPPFGKDLWAGISFNMDKLELDFKNGARQNPDTKVKLHQVEAEWTFVDEFGGYIGYNTPTYSRATSSSKMLILDGPSAAVGASENVIGGKQPHVRLFGKLADGVVKYTFSYGDGANSLGELKGIDKSATAVQKKSWGDLLAVRLELAPPGLVEKGWDDTGIGEKNFVALGLGGAFMGDRKYDAGAKTDVDLKTNILLADLSGRYRFGDAGAITGSTGYVVFKKDYSYKEDEKPKGYFAQLGFLIPGKALNGQFEPVVKYDVYDYDTAGKTETKEKTFAIGFNHYLSKHNVKWGYNFVQTKYDKDVRVAANDDTRNLHQIQMQLQF
ncbi:MAG: OprO/OprP family phosphate-selective porin [Euryarchaeota archaeon]|nr:OprO/OprP family phosphate-selective porin [Euryarchaeota archaeon]